MKFRGSVRRLYNSVKRSCLSFFSSLPYTTDLPVYPLGVYDRLRTSNILHTITQQYKKCYIKYINVLPLNRIAGAFTPFFYERTLSNAEEKPQLYSRVHTHALLVI